MFADFFANLFSKRGFKLDAAQRAKGAKILGGLALLLIVAVSVFVGRWTAGGLPGDDPRSDVQVLALGVHFRFWVALGFSALVAGLTYLLWLWKERTSLGRDLFTWRLEKDPELVPAARTLGACVFLGFVFLGLCVLFAGVLR